MKLPCLAALALLCALPAQAQTPPQDQPVVAPAPPAVRDFQLKADTPAAAAPAVQQPVELPRIDVAPPASTPAPAVDEAVADEAPATTAPAAQGSARAAPSSRRARATPEPLPPPTLDPAPAPAPASEAPAAAPPQPSAAAPSASPAAETEVENFPWLYLLAGLALLAAIAVVALRRRRVERDYANPVVDEPAEAVPAPVAAAAEPVAAAVPAQPAAEPRPRLKLGFKPLMAGSTEDQAAVQFELTVRNEGEAVARNVRIAMRMIHAGPQQNDELAAFFETAIATTEQAPLTIPPGGRAETRQTAALPKDSVQAISFQGKSLFIPVMAFNVLYEWGDGEQGQTATSFVVGRETNPPTEKMAPFRLDLGPRIYRTVGHRQNALELVA